MVSKKFAIGFFSLFLVLLIVLLTVYFILAKKFSNEILTVVWMVIIFLFVLFGVILISLVMNYIRKKK